MAEKKDRKRKKEKVNVQSGNKYTHLEPGKGPITVQACEIEEAEKEREG